jgi:hypothetical protein
VVWVLLGIIILLLNLVADCVVFILHLYQNKMNYRKEKQKSMKLSPETYDLIYEGFEYEHKTGRKQIRYQSVITPIKEELQVVSHIQSIIFGSSPSLDQDHTYEESMRKIKEFVLIKKVLFGCSIPKDGLLLMYPETMKSMLHEMKMSTRLLKLCKAWGDNVNVKKNTKILDYQDDKFMNTKNNYNDLLIKSNKKKDEEPYLNRFVIHS